MTVSNLARMTSALLASLLIASACITLLFDGRTTSLDMASFKASAGPSLIYGTPLAILAAIGTETLRLRQLSVQLLLSLTVILLTALLLVGAQSLDAPAFTQDVWHSFVLLITAGFSGLAYWLIWGRLAGWRGDSVERAEQTVIKAFAAAGAPAEFNHCWVCLAGWLALTLPTFIALGWGCISLSGLEARLLAEVEAQGNQILKRSGRAWATFAIVDDRGVLLGLAPSKKDMIAAHDELRKSLVAVTGIPGVVASIDNNADVQATTGADRQNGDVEPPAKIENPRPVPVEPAPAAVSRGGGQEATKAAQGDQATSDNAPSAALRDSDGPRAAREAAETAVADAATEDSWVDRTQSDPPPCGSDHLATIKSSVILFERQRYDIARSYDGEFERLADSAIACAPWAILISGHADPRGDNLFNERLSRLRAITARQKLIDLGVSADLLVAKRANSATEFAYSNEEAALRWRVDFGLVRPSEISRDATQDPGERVRNCESDLSDLMTRSIVHFPPGSARVSAESIGLVNDLAKAIHLCGSVIITVEGHTDKIGTAEQNQQLSEVRATSVRLLLVEAGVDPTRVMTRGFASEQPYQRGNTAEAYALNRRIEFKVSGKFTSDNTGGP